MSRLYRERWTFRGIQMFPGLGVLLLVNLPNKSTRTLVAYEAKRPVLIKEKNQ